MEETDKEKELKDLLLPYIQKAMKDKPQDYIDHAANYFNGLLGEKKKKKSKIVEDEESKEFIEEVLGNRKTKRDSVFAEPYNPEHEDDTDETPVVPKTDEERNKIISKSEDIFLFRVLEKSDLMAVIDAMEKVSVEEGQVIIKQGDDGDKFYLVDEGKFNAYIEDEKSDDKLVATYEDQGYFGELALLHNQPRAATVKAETKGLLWAVTRPVFNKLIVRRAFEKRRLYMQLLDLVPALKPLTEYEKMQVADALKGETFTSEAIIVKEGDEGDGMYFIVEGKVSVRQRSSSDDGEQNQEINQLKKGDFFGELALVEHQPRAATVVALEETKVAFLDVKAFERLLGPCMEILRRHTETYERKK